MLTNLMGSKWAKLVSALDLDLINAGVSKQYLIFSLTKLLLQTIIFIRMTAAPLYNKADNINFTQTKLKPNVFINYCTLRTSLGHTLSAIQFTIL